MIVELHLYGIGFDTYKTSVQVHCTIDDFNSETSGCVRDDGPWRSG